ncbi:aminotransferase class V [Chlorella virus XW01]|nr:aminotransferase class V [Chlorella virus XW01]
MIRISDEIKEKLFYPKISINTSLKKEVPLIFADDIASGRPSPYIDKLITDKILPYYANTHSNATTGETMADKLSLTRDKIRDFYGLDKSYKIIFTGSGCTSAINHLINLLDYDTHKNTKVYISRLEHYSNHLPWLELCKRELVKLNIIDLDDNNEIDYEQLENLIKNSMDKTLKIISMTGGSNVSGVLTNIKKLLEIKKKYDNVLLFLDNACIAPYIRDKYLGVDAIFISGHKFIGGQTTPGILIAKKTLFEKDAPFSPGGGSVMRLDKQKPIYSTDIETRESGGTPNILGIIRLFYVFRLYESLMPIIDKNNKFLNNYLKDKFKILMEKYKDLYVLNINTENKLPIISFNIKNIHYNFIVVLLNDLFGIQTRGGISCCGLLADHLEKKYKFRGWVRISFSWKMTIEEVDYILDAIEYVINNLDKYKSKYRYVKDKNKFIYSSSS